ncbi:helix-turn-helix domain-containing protein [Pseudomonas lactis]|jgi:transcriptional regulator with XRE-family HTH domain|uniref:helix-turn-helix domain-containing protein n=1 Tax=Pseudomonas lactis TaxID=1615674 RepID=UPI0019E004CC|nr:helix-turn-helix transcriptional regulator [Pseudomonas lactis]MBA6043602.1 XRE family transcriptional regulator [Pseudomonas lactis]
MYISDGVGDRLKEERDRLSLNQTDFGALGSVSRGTQKAYEQGTNSPDLRYLAALEVAGVDVQYVLTGVKAALSKDGLDSVESKVLENYRSLSEGDKASVLRLTSALAIPTSV